MGARRYGEVRRIASHPSLQCADHRFLEQIIGKLTGIARRETTRAPMEVLETVRISRDAGLANDFRGRSRKRQVTLISAGAWGDVCAEIGEDLPWTARRANLLVDGIDLPRVTGDIIRIGDVSLRVELETDPCSRMDEQYAGLKQALSKDWRGGVCCTVQRGGEVSIGDAVSVRSADAD